MLKMRPFLCSGHQPSNGIIMTKNNNHPPYNSISAIDGDDDEFIDIEVNSSFSPQKSTDFEFQMTPIFTKHLTNNADDLFYKGKLLPLHHLQIVQNSIVEEDDFIIMDFDTTIATSSSTSAPLMSCRVSFELVRPSNDDYFERQRSIKNDRNLPEEEKSWPEKLKLKVKSLISNRESISGPTCLRSLLLFRKSSTKASAGNIAKEVLVKVEHKKTRFGRIGRVIWKMSKKGISDEEKICDHRRSFSFSEFSSPRETTKRRQPMKCLAPRPSSSSSGASSSSFCSSSPFSPISFGSSDDYYELNFNNNNYKRSYGVTSDIIVEGTIEAAIGHCKKVSSTKAKKNKE